MCNPSIVAEDWVIKGCHIHVDGVELSVAPDHLSGIVFQAVFSSTPTAKLLKAIKTAKEICLPDKRVRARWIRDTERAKRYMLSYEGHLQSLANGRMLEFTFLVLALKRYEQ